MLWLGTLVFDTLQEYGGDRGVGIVVEANDLVSEGPGMDDGEENTSSFDFSFDFFLSPSSDSDLKM